MIINTNSRRRTRELERQKDRMAQFELSLSAQTVQWEEIHLKVVLAQENDR